MRRASAVFIWQPMDHTWKRKSVSGASHLRREAAPKFYTGKAMSEFQVVSEFQPAGHQPKAIAELLDGLRRGYREQTLLGVTGSGKTFTMANVLANLGRPSLVIAHNKTLAAQLCSELKEFLPDNAVEYFVSYYDYYQPEAYIPSSDTYI